MSIWSFIINADIVVKLVMLILVGASIAAWTIIFQRFRLFKQVKETNSQFEKLFWSGRELNTIYRELNQDGLPRSGLVNIFLEGFKEFSRFSGQLSPSTLLEPISRAMRIAQARETQQLENHLSFLATVGSTSPYVGLFGTVWGIMHAFQALGQVSQATISMVAPGISEALIATAIGLFAAIPAVISYNRFSNALQQLNDTADIFQEELIHIFQRSNISPREKTHDQA